METKKKSLISQSLPFLKGYRFIFVLALIFTVFCEYLSWFNNVRMTTKHHICSPVNHLTI